MATNEDNLDYATSQAVDGVLSDFDARNLGDALRSPEAREMTAAHEKINSLLRAYDPLPPVDFDSLSASISAAVAGEESHVPAPIPMRPSWTRRLAYVAAVGLVAMAAWPFLAKPNAPGLDGQQSRVTGPEAAPTSNGTIEIRVGPSEAMVQRGLEKGIDTALVGGIDKNKPRVVITSATQPSEFRPF